MSRYQQTKLSIKAFSQLGPRQTGLYALYQFGLRTGHYQRVLSESLVKLDRLNHGHALDIQLCLPVLPDKNRMLNLIGDKVDQLYREADEIVNGSVRLFGGQPSPLELTFPGKLENWTQYETANTYLHKQDVKFIWEPGRFGWACKLAMAYHLSEDERYSNAFWLYTERFLNNNPPYNGPHWSSAQEVAIRLVALSFALQAFSQSKQTTPDRLKTIAKAITIHAERIPPTLVYARSQNNNHLITEAMGLYTASVLLSEHPLAPGWHKLGWKWLKYAFRSQISIDGTYTQHSTNYHRLMLQAACWVYSIHNHSFPNEVIPSEVLTRLEASTQWLWKLVDRESGRVPNLGHNDGAYILPLTVYPYHDYRPVVQAASHSFLGTRLNPGDPLEDMTLWMSSIVPEHQHQAKVNRWNLPTYQEGMDTQPPHIIKNQKNGSWATFRIATYRSRPAHADQLHLDLWWHGCNLAQDPGTYLYNSPPPWENALTSAFVHNTVVVDDQEFMLHAGRFLYLDWAQARLLSSYRSNSEDCESLTAQHNGYRKIGVTHSRTVTAHPDGHWEINDRLVGSSEKVHTARLHWLLPDWEYELQEPAADNNITSYLLRIKSPFGWVTLKIGVSQSKKSMPIVQSIHFQLVRAAQLLSGTGTVSPITGWTSPTYGEKIPALACILEFTSALPIELKSEWILPSES
jgi:hypothetical protein